MADMTTKILTVELKADAAVNGIINLNNAIAKNTDQMKANAAQIKQNNAEIEKGTGDVMKLTAQNQVLAQSNVELSAKTKVLKDERRLLEKETRNEIKTQTEEEGSLRQLRAALSQATQEFDKLSRAERENGTRGKELKADINRLTTEIKDAEFATQRYYRNVGNYQNAILNAIGMNGRFGQSIMNITNITSSSTTTISQSFSAMGGSIKAFGASLMGLLTNPVFLAIAGIAGAGMAFKWFYDYNEGLAEATRLTREFTGYAGDDLVAMRNKIQATADVMGKDFKETLQSADAVMANFHVNGEEAMDIINKGFAAGADVNGDFLAKVQQLAPTFHDAGIKADEMVAIIAQTRSGIFTDQGLEAIKQGSARIREMSGNTKQALQGIGIDVAAMQEKMRNGTMSTFDAVKQVSAQLKTLPNDSQEVGEVMSAVFGRQGKFASQEMIESLADMSTSLDEVKDKTGEYGDLLLENINTEEELDQVTSAIFDMTNKGWEEAKQKATIYAKKALVAVVKGILDVCNWFIRLYNQSIVVRAGVQAIILNFKTLWSAAKFVIGVIISGFKNIGRMIEAWVKAFNIAGNAIKGVAQGIAGIFKGIWDMDSAEISAAVDKIASAASTGAKGIVSAFSDAWSQGMNDLKGNFETFVGDVVDNVKTSFNNMNGQLNELHLSSFSGGASDGGGGGNNNNTNINNYRGGTGGKPKGGGSNRGSSGGSSSSNKPSTKDELEKERERLENLANKLLEDAEKIRQKALQELAKVDEASINQMYENQKAEIKKKYAELFSHAEQFDKNQLEALRNAQQELLDNLEEQRKKAVQDLKNAQANQLVQNTIDSLPELSPTRHKLEMQLLDQQQKQELVKIKGHEEEITAILNKYAAQRSQLSKNASDEEIRAIEDAQLRELTAVTGNQELTLSVLSKFAKKRMDLQQEYGKKQMDYTKTRLQTQIAGIDAELGDLQRRLDLEKQLIDIEMQEELKRYEGNEEMKTAIKEKYLQQREQLERQYAEKQREIDMQKYQAAANIAGALSQLAGEMSEENKDALAASKMLALAEIMINQAIAISNAIKAGSNAVSPWQMIAQIATSVTAVTVAMMQAFKALDEAKFATGGFIRGAGTSTSDSIPIRVSNGESVMNAQTTAMFGGLLSSLNQLGGGVPIQVQETAASVRGEDMLARAFARGVAMLPNPVVSVEDINRGQRQVEVMNERATL